MAAVQDLYGGIQENYQVGSANNGTATATQPAPGVDKQLLITGFSISANGTIAAGVVGAIRQNGGVVSRRQFIIPAGSILPIIYEFKRPIAVPANQDCDITIGALGVGITGQVELTTITRPAYYVGALATG